MIVVVAEHPVDIAVAVQIVLMDALQDAGAPTFNSVYFQCGGR